MDNQTITTSEFVFRRLEDPIKIPGWSELSGWLWLPVLGIILFLGLVYIIWMYSRDAHSIGWFPATLLGMLRATVYGILAWVFLLPAYQTWEESRTHSRVILAFDTSQSVAFTRDDIPPDGVSPDKMPTRQDKIINLLTDAQMGFMSGLTAKNPVMAYRFGRLADDDFLVFTPDGHWTRKDWDDHNRPRPVPKEGEPPPPPPPQAKPFGLEQFQNWLKPDPKLVLPDGLTEDEEKTFQKKQEYLQKLFTGTNLGESLLSVVNKEAINMLQGVVVFSDGHSTEGSLLKLRELAERCDKAGIPMFIVGVGEDRQPIKIDIADVIAPPQARPEDEFRVTVEVIGEGLANEELKELYLDIYKPGEYNPKDKNSTPTKTLTPKSPVRFSPGEMPRGKAEFDIKPALFAPPATGAKKPEFEEGTWTMIARVPKDKREIFLKPNHLSDPVEIRVVKRPLRILMFTSGAMKDYQFSRTLFAREVKEGRAEMCVHVQPPPGMDQPRKGIVADVPPERLLTRFPDLLQEEDTVMGDDKFYNLSAYDVIIAFDPDWSRLTVDQLNKLEQWVDKQGGGLMIVAAPVNMLQLYRAILDDKDKEKEKYKPIERLLPVRLEDPRTLQVERDLSKKWRLNFPGANPQLEFLQLEEGVDKNGQPYGLLDGWETFFTGDASKLGQKTDVRGFISYYPVQKAKDSAIVVATLSDPLAKLKEENGGGEQPYLVTTDYGSGRILWLGSGETWRFREFRDAYFERFWTKAARYVGARGVNRLNRRIQPFHGRNYNANSYVTIEAQILGRDLRALPQSAKPKLVMTMPPGAERDTPPSIEMVPKPSQVDWNGYFTARFLVRTPGEYKFDLKVDETQDSAQGVFLVKDFNPETDDTRPDFDTLFWLSSDATKVIERITDEGERKKVRQGLLASKPKLGTLIDKIGREEPENKDNNNNKEGLRLYFDLSQAHLIPQCMTTVTRDFKNRGATNDLWDKGLVLNLGEANPFAPLWDFVTTRDLAHLNRIWGVNLVLLIVNVLLAIVTVIILGMTISAFMRGKASEVGYYLLFTVLLLVALVPLQWFLAYLNKPVLLSAVLVLVVVLLAVEWLTRKLLRLA